MERFDRAFSLVDKLLNEYGEANIAERLMDDIQNSHSWEVVADLFGMLIWSTSDNGHELTNTTEQWLRDANDEARVNIALNLDVVPFGDLAERKLVLNNISRKFPTTKELCDAFLEIQH